MVFFLGFLCVLQSSARLLLDWFHLRSDSGRDLGLLGGKLQFSTLLAGVASPRHPFTRVSVLKGWFVPNWASVSEREADR